MRFEPTAIPGCTIVDVEAHEDDRGLFARTWCAREFNEAGVSFDVAQCSVSRNPYKGTLRGMHYQLPPSREGKLVRCTRGAIFDVVVDLRADSEAFLKQVTVDLTADNLRALLIPPGCAHGFQTLAEDTDVLYQMSDFYAPDLGAGLRWNDPVLGVEWPLAIAKMNDRDRKYPDMDRGRIESLRWE